GTSILNYTKSLNETEKQLKNSSLPLSIDNIYTEIQKNVIEPNLISSMMSSNTFLKDWLINEESNIPKIKKYLSTIKDKYSMFNTFLVSHESKNYYSSKGFLEKVDISNPQNAWYYNFKELSKSSEINLDYNKYMDSSMIMFINYKIFDDNSKYLGATGIAIKTSYVNDMLKSFRKNYKFNVYFINKLGRVVLSETGVNTLKNINDIAQLQEFKEDIFDTKTKTIEYQKDGNTYLLNSKYIEELGLYLLVEAQVEDFTKEVKKTFYINLSVSLLVTLIVILIILYMIKIYNKKLEYLVLHDPLTKLPNRRSFNNSFERSLLLFNRNKNSKALLFFDVDDFKKVNDEFGHLLGDKVLIQISSILQKEVRKSDYISRWGGEEFSILLHDLSLEDAKVFALNLKDKIEHDEVLNQLIKKRLTASFGLTMFKENDNMDGLVNRVDQALYDAKNSGKNKVCVR
ncbi:MAG: GGDEF domain-containing protein, partial [Campylobacteraceae bacterium]|nr:GGDEF domain-containing protein [Campylobacteraceae bacterium]